VLNQATKDSSAKDKSGFETILFPLLGTGAGRAGLDETIEEIVQAAIVYLEQNPDAKVKRVYFLAWREAELKSCLSFLGNSPDVEQLSTTQKGGSGKDN
jgi:O-acetyl-ADP-ribose deacetylase (regulator of RNase III)